MFEKIMVCLDGSRLAEQVLPHVITEAMSFRSKIILFQSVPGPALASPGIPGTAPAPVVTETRLKETLITEADARFYLEEIAKPLRKRNLQIETLTIPGLAGQTIINYAEKNNIDLIALATHGHSGLARTIFGSTADFVLRETRIPVLMIKPQKIVKPIPIDFTPFQKILVCLDGSKLAEQILPYTMEQAQHFNSKVVLLQAYIMTPIESVTGANISSEAPDLMKQKHTEYRNEIMIYLEKVAEPMREDGMNIACVALQGKAEDVILSYAQNEMVDLITMATHGRSSLGRTIFGSVSNHILREAGLPILLIKP